MASHKKRHLDLDPKHGSSTVKKACTPLVSDCAMKVPVVVLHKLNLELDHQNRKWNVKEPDHRACSEQDRQEDQRLDDNPVHSKLSPSPLAFNELLASNISNSSNHHLQQGTLEIRGCTSPAKEHAKVPVVRVLRLNIQTKAQEEESTNESDSEKPQDQVPALGNSNADDKMALTPFEQNTLLPHSTEITRNNDQQDCDQKAVCRKQLKVQLFRMNIETKNQVEKQATSERDSDHEDVQPTICSLLNVQHENQEELSTDDSDSDQCNEQDLENLSLYERQRLKNIKQNAKFLKSIKLLEVSSALYRLKKQKTVVRREKPHIDTVMRRSNRLQGIASSSQMLRGKRQYAIQEKGSMRGLSLWGKDGALKWRTKPKRDARKRKTTIQIDRRITVMAKAQPMISSKMIRDSLKLSVSTMTVRRRLYEANLLPRRPRKVPLLKRTKKDMCIYNTICQRAHQLALREMEKHFVD
ncbi:WD repeat-containing protein 76 [Phyllobates terribilis]|uniref:WD repeat-containing protein 76 n=1 Tax=Phyllobates terribilis TaxID=111132 RepID=UPI003CCAE91E